jgi:hypothetical protein
MSSFTPPFCKTHDLARSVEDTGFALLAPSSIEEISGHTTEEWQKLSAHWHELAPDQYLKDGGRYRKRKHSSLVVTGQKIDLMPHRAHWQPLAYNALHGGIDRWFEPCTESFIQDEALQSLIIKLCSQFSILKQVPQNSTPWYVEVHQFRIDTTDGIGRPTPEGAHRDGVDFVGVMLINRQHIKGGETRIFRNASPDGQRFTLEDPLSLLILDDEKVIHETTPIQPLDAVPQLSCRDTLVLTFRLKSFQDSTQV